MKQNAADSADYEDLVNRFLQTYDSWVSVLETKKAGLADTDFAGKMKINAQEITELEEKAAAYVAAGLKNSEDYIKNENQIKKLKNENLELTKQQYEYEIKLLKEQLDAYSTIADYAISQLNERKSLTNEIYDKEISALEQINS